MAVETNRYTSSGNIARADSANVAVIPMVLAGGLNPDDPSIGLRIKVDIVANVSGVVEKLSAELHVILGAYLDGGGVAFSTLPSSPSSDGEFTIATGTQQNVYQHLVFPDINRWIQFFKIVLSYDTPVSNEANLYVTVYAPDVNCSYTAETLTYFKI